jgi:hypothetical protein
MIGEINQKILVFSDSMFSGLRKSQNTGPAGQC